MQKYIAVHRFRFIPLLLVTAVNKTAEYRSAVTAAERVRSLTPIMNLEVLWRYLPVFLFIL